MSNDYFSQNKGNFTHYPFEELSRTNNKREQHKQVRQIGLLSEEEVFAKMQKLQQKVMHADLMGVNPHVRAQWQRILDVYQDEYNIKQDEANDRRAQEKARLNPDFKLPVKSGVAMESDPSMTDVNTNHIIQQAEWEAQAWLEKNRQAKHTSPKVKDQQSQEPYETNLEEKKD